MLSQVCWEEILKRESIKYVLFPEDDQAWLFTLVERPIFLLTERTWPLKAMLTAIRGSSQGIKEEIPMVKKEADA